MLFASTPQSARPISSREALEFKTGSTAPISKVLQFNFLEAGFNFYFRRTADSFRHRSHLFISAPQTHPPETAGFIYVK